VRLRRVDTGDQLEESLRRGSGEFFGGDPDRGDAGRGQPASPKASNPAIDATRATSRPLARSSLMAPYAISSFAAKMASKRWPVARS
jgi:hypothetical protein